LVINNSMSKIINVWLIYFSNTNNIETYKKPEVNIDNVIYMDDKILWMMS
jgi:hypothetical protein